jgi:hypothetical protein
MSNQEERELRFAAVMLCQAYELMQDDDSENKSVIDYMSVAAEQTMALEAASTQMHNGDCVNQAATCLRCAWEDYQIRIDQAILARRRLMAETDKAAEATGPGTPLARLGAIARYAQEHCGYNPVSARPPELALIEALEAAKAALDATRKTGVAN